HLHAVLFVAAPRYPVWAVVEPAARTWRPTGVTVKPLAALTALALALGGCATAHPTPVGAPPSVTVPGTGLVFQIVNVPGLIPPGGSFTMPRVALYGDGLLVLPGSELHPLPGSELHPVARRLTPAGVRKVVQAAADAGLASITDYGTPPVMDAGETRFT